MAVANLISQLRELDIKLWTEGDRLRIDAPKGVFTSELRSELAERKEEILAFLQRLISDAGMFPVSYNQQAFWFVTQLAPDSSIYNIISASRVVSEVDVDALRRAAEGLVERHGSLRTTFAMSSEGLRQEVHPEGSLCFEQVDARDWACGAYVLLDPTYPAERLAHMVKDAGAALLLTQQPLVGTVLVEGLREIVLVARDI